MLIPTNNFAHCISQCKVHLRLEHTYSTDKVPHGKQGICIDVLE